MLSLQSHARVPPATPRRARQIQAALVLTVAAAAVGCPVRVIPLRAERPPLPAAGQALEVIPSLAGAADPMPVRFTDIAFGDVAVTTARLIAAAAAPWAARHARERPGGWQMLLEIVRSDAEVREGRLTVEIEARVTVRATAGQMHIGQTRGYCRQSDDLGGGDGSPVVNRCLERMSRDLAGWLEGLNP